MGGGNSTQVNLNQADAVIVRLMMPVYYTLEETTEEEHIMAQSSWTMILNNTAPKYVDCKDDPNFKYHSAVVFFHDSFYDRLFNIHPMARELFKSGMKSQGKFLVQMITLSLSELKMKEKFDKTLRKLAEIHHQRSVKAIEYGQVGDILFWTLQKVLGVEIYTHELHKCWIKIYSRMLQTIVPVAVALEVADGSKQVNRVNEQQASMFNNTKDNTTAADGSTKRSSSNESAKSNGPRSMRAIDFVVLDGTDYHGSFLTNEAEP